MISGALLLVSCTLYGMHLTVEFNLMINEKSSKN